MSNSNNRIIDSRTHGLARTFLVRTRRGSSPAQPITCFASYKVNNRPLIDSDVEISDGDWQAIKSYFTYSRNGGPIQRVMIDDDADDWAAVEALYAKIDTDLCRAQDGESLAFYILSYDIGLTEQVIPDLNDIDLPPDIIPPIELNRMVMSEVPEPPTYDYTITGISGDGLIPIPNVFNIDSRNISIPHPYSAIDSETVEWSAWPRWYPSNTIVKEDNTIVIYPSEGVEPHDFDLFRVLGGVDNTPITINSCVKAVPRKYSCEASYAVGSQVGSSLILTRMAVSRDGANAQGYREPVRFSESPFPFKAIDWRGAAVSWPPSMRAEVGTRGADWIASYRRNDGPLKVIAWNTGSREPGTHHSVWDAIKELLLDDYGRTIFMLSDFNSTMSPHSPETGMTVKSGLTSNLTFTYSPPIEGNPTHMSQRPYRFAGKSVEVRDRQIQFSDESAGAVWNENTITIYPTPYSVANEYEFDGYSDYYEYLCQYYDQLEAGEPITIHSCAAVEPVDHIQVNTGFKIDRSAMGEVMPPGLIARVQINDGEIKEFANEGALSEKTIADLLNYVTLLGADPIITTSPGMGDNPIQYARAQSKTNLLYFKTNMLGREPTLTGCSGIERPDDPRMGFMTIDMDSQKMEMLQVEILDDMDSDIPHVRTSNKVTFHKAVGSKYVDFFDFIVGAKGNTHTIYSSAGVPCQLIGGSIEGGGDNGSMDDLEYEYMQWRAPWVFKLTKTNGRYESFNPTVFAQYGTDFVITDYDTGERLASSFGRTHEGIIERIPENNNLDIIFDMDKLNTSRTFELYFGITGGSVIFGNDTTKGSLKEGELEIIEWNSDCAPKVRISAANMTVKLPQTLPKEWKRLNSMFAYANMANPDISMWDVSHVVDMDYMFENALAFNQDLSKWCVNLITSKPFSFDDLASVWTLPKPVWGTCPVTLPPGIPLEFNLTTPDDPTQSAPLTFELENWGVGWNLYEDDVLISNSETMGPGVSHSMGGFNRQIIKVDNNNFTNKTVNYKMYVNNDHLNVSRGFKESSSMYPSVEVLSFSDTSRRQSLRFAWTDMTVPTVLPQNITSTVTMFDGCQRFNQDISMWDTSHVEDMSVMFRNCISFNQPIGVWNVSNVTDITEMFAGCSSFNQDLSGWDVSRVKRIQGTFEDATVFNSDISGWNLDSAMDYQSAFKNAIAFNQDISRWKTSNVLHMSQMFSGAHAFNQDISKWDVKQVQHMAEMFYDAQSFNQDLSGWCVTNITRKPNNFSAGATAWTKPKPVWGTCPPPPTHMPEYTPFEFNVTSSGGAGFALETSGNPTEWMLYQDDVLITTEETRTNHRVSDLKEGVTNFKLFTDGASINMREGSAGTNTTIDFLSFCEAVPRTNFSIQSYNFTVPKTLPANHTDLRDMFKGCNAFNQDLSEWDTSRVTDMSQMFYETDVFNGNITTWNTSQVTNFTRMFSSARVFNQDISNWDVSNALYMGGMFDIALVFNQPIGNWDIAKVTSTQDMFKNAWEFNQDLSSWNVSNVQSMNGMFFVAKAFNQDLSGWNVAHIPDEPINFANLAAAWSEPKPVWGTVGTPKV